MEEMIVMPDGVVFVLPLFDSSLSYVLKTYGYLDETNIAFIAREVAKGLAAAHSLGVLHRDIKPCNILLTGGHVVVADWGLCRDVRDVSPGHMSSEVVTLWYAPPEIVCEQTTYGSSVDVYSLGMTMLDMLAGRSMHTSIVRSTFMTQMFRLFGTKHLTDREREWLDQIMPERYPRVREYPETPGTYNFVMDTCSASANLQDLLKGMLAIIPDDRFTWAQVLAHPFLAGDLTPVSFGGPLSVPGSVKCKRHRIPWRWKPKCISVCRLLLRSCSTFEETAAV